METDPDHQYIKSSYGIKLEWECAESINVLNSSTFHDIFVKFSLSFSTKQTYLDIPLSNSYGLLSEMLNRNNIFRHVLEKDSCMLLFYTPLLCLYHKVITDAYFFKNNLWRYTSRIKLNKERYGKIEFWLNWHTIQVNFTKPLNWHTIQVNFTKPLNWQLFLLTLRICILSRNRPNN
jgi:hypothetical protein